MTLASMNDPVCRESIDYLVGVFDGFPAALVSVDARLRIIMFNRHAERLTGFRASEIMRKRVTSVIRIENVRYIMSILRGRKEFAADGFITKLRAKDGTDIPVQIVVSPLRKKRAAPTGFLCVVSDLRSVKRFQGKLLEAERLSALSEIAIGLNHAMEAEGIRVLETDLGEYIVQLKGMGPAHIVVPAFHLSREEIAALFREKLGVDAPAEAEKLTQVARMKLREEFLNADLGISGGNFLVAETGTIVMVNSEIAPLQIN